MTNNSASQGGNWSARAAFWEKTAPEGASVTDELNQVLIGLTGIAPGHHVLDLASGTGEPAISIAQMVGPKGSVTALDAHAEMLAGAERRAANLGLGNMNFEVTRMEALPFEDGRFDAVTCRFGLMSSDDPVATLRETRRVLKPGGKAAFMTHGVNEKNTLSAVTERIVREFLGEPSGPGLARRLRFSAEGSLREVFEAAGFHDIGEREIERTRTEARGERFWTPIVERRFGPKLEALDAGRFEDLDRRLEEAFAPYLKDETYELRTADMVGWGTA